MVDLHEREYLKSQNVVTETQCDLGLTALKLDEVLELMSTDYPEKCHVSDLKEVTGADLFLSSQQFNHVWQQKRRALVATNNHGPSSMASLIPASNTHSSSVSHTPSVNPSDHTDKNRALVSIDSATLFTRKLLLLFFNLQKLRKDLLRSAMDYNTQLQRERLQDRKACFDLQTMVRSLFDPCINVFLSRDH